MLININTRIISESGILTSLSLVILIFAALSPVNKIFIASGSALILEVAIKRNNLKVSLLVFLPTAILSFLLLPYKMIAILYICIFGGYSLLRNYFILKNKLLKKLIMIIYVDAVFFLLLILANKVFENIFETIIKGSFWQNLILFFVLQVAVLLYDYGLDIASRLLLNKLRDIGF